MVDLSVSTQTVSSLWMGTVYINPLILQPLVWYLTHDKCLMVRQMSE